VRLAARGARETAGGGVAAIEHAEDAQQLKRQAARIVREAIAIAVVVIGVVMLAREIFSSGS
jgi:hypothetical protein